MCWQQKKIKEFEPIIKNVVKEEAEEAAMAQADMQVRKAQNMIDHEDEIFSRAPRQWIMDETRRKDTKGWFVVLFYAFPSESS